MKTAVIYFSRTKNTESVAERLAKQLGADLLPIRSSIYPPGWRGYLRAIRAAFRKDPEKIEIGSWELSDYDLVIVGTPIWGSRPSEPIRSFLTTYGEKIHRVAFFVTCGGSGADSVFQRMSELCRLQPIATMTVTASDLARQLTPQKINAFITRIFQPEAAPKSQPVLST